MTDHAETKIATSRSMRVAQMTGFCRPFQVVECPIEAPRAGGALVRVEASAAAVANQLVWLSPTFAGAYTDLAKPLLYPGRLDDALAATQKEADESWKLATLPLVYWALGRRGESDATLQQFESKYADVGAYNIAEIYAYRGQTDAAFSWLERAYRQRDSGMSAVRGDPLLQNLRKDPRFMAVLAKMKLDRDSLTTSR